MSIPCLILFKDGKMIKEMSAEEFENDCKKSISIITDKKIDKVLKVNNYKYKLTSDNQANIFPTANPVRLH